MKKQKQQAAAAKSAKMIWMIVAAVVVFGGIAWYSLSGTPQTEETRSAQPDVKLATLSPLMFTGKVREAYQVAQDIPDILKQVQCYCGCKALGHTSNFFCFVDQHAVGCQMCQNIALETKKMHDSGMPVSQIKEAIRVKYEHAEE